jgi:hypothetical protein
MPHVGLCRMIDRYGRHTSSRHAAKSTSFARIHGGVTAAELVSAVDGLVANARKQSALTTGGELMFGLVF